MEATMQKTIVTVFGALLISGMAVQMATASEHHRHVTKANFSRHHAADFRDKRADQCQCHPKCALTARHGL
jgi:hypothetical protein